MVQLYCTEDCRYPAAGVHYIQHGQLLENRVKEIEPFNTRGRAKPHPLIVIDDVHIKVMEFFAPY